MMEMPAAWLAEIDAMIAEAETRAQVLRELRAKASPELAPAEPLKALPAPGGGAVKLRKLRKLRKTKSKSERRPAKPRKPKKGAKPGRDLAVIDKSRNLGTGGGLEFEVNGKTLSVSAREFEALKLLSAVLGACVATDSLEAIFGSRQAMHNGVFHLNKKLAAAGSKLGFYKGEGYRLEAKA